MQFFKRILNFSDPASASRERRGKQRYAPNAKFPLKAVLNLAGRDDTGAVLQNSRGGGWDWSGRLVNFSDTGVRMQVPASVIAAKGDHCQLKLSLEGYHLDLPGHIANVREQYGSILYGLKLEIQEECTQLAYQQLIELVALGSTLKPLTKGPVPDQSGYLVEQFAGTPRSRLSIWRNQVGRAVTAFEFHLKDCGVRGAKGSGLEYLTGPGLIESQPASTAQTAEIHRLFHWVVPNLASAVPTDAREFLQSYAA